MRACPTTGQSDPQLCNVVDASGQRYLELGYYADGRIQEVRDPLGRKVRYTYTAGQLDGAYLGDGSTEQTIETYQYVPNHLLSSVTSDNVATLVQNSYDRLGRVVRQVIAGTTITYSYARSAAGVTTTVVRQGQDGTREKLVDVYRRDGTLKKQIQNDRLIKYVTFDPRLAFSSISDANGHTTLVQSNAQGQPTISCSTAPACRRRPGAARQLLPRPTGQLSRRPVRRPLLQHRREPAHRRAHPSQRRPRPAARLPRQQ